MSDIFPKLGPLGSLVGYHLRRASAAFAPDPRKAKKVGMRPGQFGILAIVASNPGINQTSVGNALGIQRANMVALVDELADKGWLKRSLVAEDRRVRQLSLTSAGRRKLESISRRLKKAETKALGDLTTGEREILLDLLDRIASRAGTPSSRNPAG
jgi:DNA-binding MarR family transcriptional regulator